MGYSKTIEVGQSYILSDNLLASNDTLKVVGGAAYYLHKSMMIVNEVFHNSSLRFKFTIGSGADICYGKIYKNGVPVGTEKSKAGAPVEQTDDIVFTDLKVNDSLELWCYSPGGGSVHNFRIYGTPSMMYNTLE